MSVYIDRTFTAIRGAEGKRLAYRQPDGTGLGFKTTRLFALAREAFEEGEALVGFPFGFFRVMLLASAGGVLNVPRSAASKRRSASSASSPWAFPRCPISLSLSMALEHDVKDFTEMFFTLDAGLSQPRVTAIVIAAYIEDYLARLVQTRLPGLTHKKDDETKKKLFGTSGILSTNAANIEMAHAIGLIDNALKNELKTIARIRNRFAHNIKINDFGHPEIDELCKKLRFHEGFEIPYYDHLPGNLKIFCKSAMHIASMLNNMVLKHANNTERIEVLIREHEKSAHNDIVNSLKLLRSMLATVSRKS